MRAATELENADKRKDLEAIITEYVAWKKENSCMGRDYCGVIYLSECEIRQGIFGNKLKNFRKLYQIYLPSIQQNISAEFNADKWIEEYEDAKASRETAKEEL